MHGLMNVTKSLCHWHNIRRKYNQRWYSNCVTRLIYGRKLGKPLKWTAHL